MTGTDKNKSDNYSLLTEFLSEENIRELAGYRFFQRGVNYFNEGRVIDLKMHKGEIRASVRGTHKYSVRFRIKEKDLEYYCNCPVGSEYDFCKHCVAAGLEWISINSEREKENGISKKAGIKLSKVEKYLLGLDKKILVDLILEQASNDDRFNNRLVLKTAKQFSKSIDLKYFRKAIKKAVETDDLLDGYSIYDHSDEINEVIDALEDILEEGFAEEVVELAQFGIECLEKNVEYDGYLDDNLYEWMERFQDLHIEACEKAGPDPVKLAQKLFEYEMNFESDLFYKAVQTYADVLCEKGLIEYRRLAEKMWEHVPQAGAEERYDEKRRRISEIMENLALMSDDIEEVVKIKSRDLSEPYNYLNIARLYKDSKMHDKAFEWAKKGIKAFPKQPNSELSNFIAEEYHDRKQYAEEMELVWAGFSDNPYIRTYEKLKFHADRIKQKEEWRDKAIGLIREKLKKEKKKHGKSNNIWVAKPDHSLLVEIFLAEKNVDAAWKEAKSGGCWENLWLELADKRSGKYPEEAIPIYKMKVEKSINTRNSYNYDEAVSYIIKIKKLMKKTGQNKQFDEYIRKLRAVYKRKRNLIALLDEKKWK